METEQNNNTQNKYKTFGYNLPVNIIGGVFKYSGLIIGMAALTIQEEQSMGVIGYGAALYVAGHLLSEFAQADVSKDNFSKLEKSIKEHLDKK